VIRRVGSTWQKSVFINVVCVIGILWLRIGIGCR